jgi:biotin transport system permease protein
LAAIEPSLRPLRLLGLSSERLALGIGLFIRLASLQRNTWLQLKQAYQVRGVHRPGLRLIIPSLRAGLRQADFMARALNVRSLASGRAHLQGHPRQE